mmetsp:Transcript_28020/g.43278  ORF Transcript_28020/g.43278 Transcript_28020/m.43278 type:complete len:188 (-) Transcript_28020:107-670(-)|eukprot:CAMPEP_0194299044 /NCGR_PEP_ID=MMETSP0169-20130528/60506_1 /TAXON_ID=218684 /ORGANISM="Corethron pennatum, Strain L29A3" /LENGTH=187 /DNA_ID=CAMNT_0039049105 /DNA_START=382 /DNA_END=945 /DNA_ORIENTATION=-
MMDSYHRIGFTDFNAILLFGQQDSDTTALSARKLHTKFAKRVEKYREEVLLTFKDRGLFKSMRKLQHRAHRCGRWTTKMQKKYDSIDRQETDFMLKAESNCAADFSNPVPWSVALMRAGTAIRYWNLRISQYSSGKVSASTMQSILTKARMVNYTGTLDQALTELVLARKSFRKCCQEAEKLCEKEL